MDRTCVRFVRFVRSASIGTGRLNKPAPRTNLSRIPASAQPASAFRNPAHLIVRQLLCLRLSSIVNIVERPVVVQ